MPQQKIFTAEILRKLAANGAATREKNRGPHGEAATIDHVPVVKVFNPYGAATWLLTESDPDEPDRLFGLCDLGFGTPELGYVLRSEIEGIRIGRGRVQLPLERDEWFKPDKTLSAYADAARAKGSIVA